MADQAVGELIRATSISPTDLFLLEQAGVAKSLTGQILMNWLVSFADGHGGIRNFEPLKTVGLVTTFRITLADETTFDFDVKNGNGIKGVQKVKTQGLVDTYAIKYDEGEDGFFTVTNGKKGDPGRNSYTHRKYASQKPTEESHSIGDIPDRWVGLCESDNPTPPTDWKKYEWYEWKGDQGDTGAPAKMVSQEVKYQVGDSGSIIPSGNWQSNVPVTPQGKYLWVRTTLTFNSGSPVVSYAVSHQGLDGSGSVSSVAGIAPDPQGNVPLRAADVGALATTGGEMTGPIKMQGQPITGLNDPEDETDAARKGYVDRIIKKAAPINLLDNSDFTNPVNQRGIANTTAKLSYPLDRWLYDFDGVPGGTGYDPENKYLCLINKSGGEKWDALYQAVPAEKLGVGKYTITLHEKIIAPVLLHVIVDDSIIVLQTAEYTPTENGIVVATFEIKQAPKNKMLVAVYARNKQTVAFDWAALYPGEYTADTIPEYHPKGYTTELLVCQRYYVRLQYQQYNTIGVGYEGSNYAFTQIALTVPMRISNPSLIVSAPIQMGSVPRTPTSASINGSNMIIELQYATITSNIGAMYCYCPTEAGVVIELSADL